MPYLERLRNMLRRSFIGRPDNVGFYMFRGVAYALTSTAALVAGYLMQATSFNPRDLLLLAIPALTSVFFFILYARRFHSLEYRSPSEKEIGERMQSQAIYIFPVVAVLLILWIVTTQTVSLRILLAFIIYGLMFLYYGFFLARLPTSGLVPRHRLFWSVLLSIGISLYYGLTFSELKSSLRPLIPVATIVAIYYLSETFEWRRLLFLRRMLFIVFVLTILGVLAQLIAMRLPDRVAKLSAGLGQFFWTLLFCVAASAYVAVFEAWKITSDIAQQESRAKHTVTGSDGSIDKASQYSIATLTALMLTVSVLPFYFIFSRYGTVFLVGFAFHAFACFVFWYLCGRGRFLLLLPWGNIKIIAGVLFLTLLVLVTFFNAQPNGHSMEWFASISGLGILLVPTSYLTLRLFLDFRRVFRRSRRSLWVRVFDRRINLVRLLSILCWLACFVIIKLLHSYPDNSAEHYKGELAFNAYAICILLCILGEALDSIGVLPPMTSLRKSILGLLSLIRIAPSSLIALCVFLPAKYKGIASSEALLMAAPFLFAAIGGFALNDYCDAEKDKINKPYRAIPSNSISATVVLVLSIVSLSFSLVLTLIVSRNWVEILLYGATILGVSLYNVFVKRLSLSKTFLTSTVSALPLLFSVIVFAFPTVFLFLPLATCSFVLGREWLMDISDVSGDKADKTTTIPMILGPSLSARLGFGFQLLSVVLLLPIVLLTRSQWNFLLLQLILLSIALFAWLWFHYQSRYQRLVIRGLWVPMLLGIMMITG